MDSHLVEFIGKVLLFRISHQFVKEARAILQTPEEAPLIYCRLLAIDGVGCWVENKRWTSTHIPTGKIHINTAHALIPWAYIVSVAAFPDPTFLGVPEEIDGAKSIGFLADI